ncbi:MAG: tRNA (adenosine(37)-N6)-dimethylallyltransferase MiaA [Gammaproteobacteria bacterium]|nr:tRNA (adenosine(37)-N6)-dimethylallyltransferase MiaA [Gammaproteobacteria bacterium]MYF27732.1 tRNA (adenosine(37)-N6)-dimethylallyltransferase MiaA [Gammaproteobacteria bacterium]MYK46901.1 tRNA (adenosine(37)-N6)-dimethylallyltransferase MiaA [Gammaproteobacteria bacterium]
MGPTAAGKTDAALGIADAALADLISVDSAMVYRRMDIGTAKPTAEMLARYPHALVNIRDPADTYSVAHFVADADEAVRSSLAAGRTPVLVGGTMLYFRAFKAGLNRLPGADPGLRRELAARADRQGWPALHGELARRDPDGAARIDPNNGQRIQRALEVLELTGRPMGFWWARTAKAAPERLGCRLVEVAIEPARALLHERIANRLDEMLRHGLVGEVRALRDDPALSIETPAMRAVGYRQVWRHLDGDYGHDAMVERIRAATRQVAKRQLTWLKGWKGLIGRVDDAPSAMVAVLQNL